MIKIIFFCNWGHNSYDLMKLYNSLTYTLDFKYKNIEITYKIEDAEWFIFFDQITINIDNIDKNKIILIQREPYINIENKYKIKNLFSYHNYIHLYTTNLHLLMNTNQLKEIKYNSNKKKLCSAVVSKLIFKNPKEAFETYSLRVNFIKIISQIDIFDIDIYGYDWNKSELGIKYKGVLGGFNEGTVKELKNEIKNTTKFDGLYDYKYSIALENCKKDNYITEKFTDCILCGTIPIYYGAKNVGDYFPKDCFYTIDLKSPSCLVDLKNILDRPITDKNIKALKEAKDLILNKYNMLEVINNTIIQ